MVKPQQLQRFEDGKNWWIATTLRPAHSPLFWSWRTSSLQLTSAIALDSDGLRIMFFTFRDSTQTTWFSLISLRVALCKASIRQSAIFAWSRATFKRALARFFEPFAFLLSWRWSSARRAAYLAVWRGLPDLNPVSVTNKSFKPTSMPTVKAVSGSETGSNSQRQDTKYRPAASRVMLMEDGEDGSGRLQHTSSGAALFAMYTAIAVFERRIHEGSSLFMAFALEYRIPDVASIYMRVSWSLQNTLKLVSHIDEGQRILGRYRAYIPARLGEPLRASTVKNRPDTS